jgi:hypothetical protein
LDFGGDREGHVPTMSRLWQIARAWWVIEFSINPELIH